MMHFISRKDYNKSLEWQILNFFLESSDVSAAYVDDEGEEWTITGEQDFESHLRNATKHCENNFHLIFKKQNQKKSELFSAKRDVIEAILPFKPREEIKMQEQTNHCMCKNKVPPIWFTDYMEQFKHKLLEEVKCNIQETIKPALHEIKKLKSSREAEKVGHQLHFNNQEKIHPAFEKDIKILQTDYPLSSNNNAKESSRDNLKKLLDKDSSNMLREQRDLKLLKKIEKLSLSKLESLESRLEEMRCDTKYLLDEKKKKSERKSHSKSKLENKNSNFIQSLKHGTIRTIDSQTQKIVKSCENFTLVLEITNNCQMPWKKPTLKCTSPKGFILKKEIKLPPLKDNQSLRFLVKGRASKEVGKYTIKFNLRDEDFSLSRFDYPIVVTTDDNVVNEKVMETFSFNDGFKSNVNELEKELKKISIHHPSVHSPNTELGNTEEKKSEKKGLDTLINLEETSHFNINEKNVKVCTCQSSLNNFLNLKEAKAKIEQDTGTLSNEKSSSMNLIDFESKSDSDLSILTISEGEEEEDEEEVDSEKFVIIPSPEQEKTQVKITTEKERTTEINLPPVSEESTISTDFTEPLISVSSKIEGKDKVLKKEKEMKKNKKMFSRSRSPLPDDRKSSKVKKIKSFKSSEYQFKASDLARPSLSIYVPCSNSNRSEKTFTFTGEHDQENKTSASSRAKENKVLTTDCLGRTIYAVNSKGYCLPVERLIKSEQGATNGDNNKSASVNILPDSLMSGASNMASLAINTAKSVINNLQSALVKEGTEMGKPAHEPMKIKSPSMEALYKLYEMGFTDLQLNKNLLLQKDNDLFQVIEELLRFQNSHTQ